MFPEAAARPQVKALNSPASRVVPHAVPAPVFLVTALTCDKIISPPVIASMFYQPVRLLSALAVGAAAHAVPSYEFTKPPRSGQVVPGSVEPVQVTVTLPFA